MALGLGLRGRPALAWAAGYVLMALAALTKGGPQPPVYFVGSVTAYLVLTRQWRRLLTRRPPGRGAARGGRHRRVGGAVLFRPGVGQPARLGWATRRRASRSGRLSEVVLHLASYPLEVLGCTAPWSLLLLAYLGGGLRRSLGEARPQAVFAAVCVGLAFPSCWLPPGGQTRTSPRSTPAWRS